MLDKYKHRVVKLLAFIFMAFYVCISILIAFDAVNYTAGHLARINTDTSLTNNQPTDIIWYKDNCQHCQEIVPTERLINKLTFHKMQRRDISNVKNSMIQGKTKDTGFPTEQVVTRHGNQYSAVKRPMMKWSSIRVVVMLIIYTAIIIFYHLSVRI